MSRVAGLTSVFDADDRVFQRVSGRVEATMRGLQGRVGASVDIVRRGFGGLALGIGAAATAMGFAVKAAAGAEASQAKLAAVLKATGNASGFSVAQMKQQAAELQRVTKFEDDATTAAQALLATYGKIHGDNFKRATVAAMDLSTVTGTDLTSAMRTVGKALNAPRSGLASLQRAGVEFTEQQRKQIVALDELGFSFRAQQIIIDQLNKSYGGAAEALGDTFTGKLTILKNELGDIAEDVGGLLLPHLRSLVEWVRSVVGETNGWTAANSPLKASIDAVAGAVAALPEQVTRLQMAMEDLSLTAQIAFLEMRRAGNTAAEMFRRDWMGATVDVGRALGALWNIAGRGGPSTQDMNSLTALAIRSAKAQSAELTQQLADLRSARDNIGKRGVERQFGRGFGIDFDAGPKPPGLDPAAVVRQMREQLVDTLSKVGAVVARAGGALVGAAWDEAGRRAKVRREPREGGFTSLADMHRTIQKAAVSDPKRDRAAELHSKTNTTLSQIAEALLPFLRRGGFPVVR